MRTFKSVKKIDRVNLPRQSHYSQGYGQQIFVFQSNVYVLVKKNYIFLEKCGDIIPGQEPHLRKVQRDPISSFGVEG